MEEEERRKWEDTEQHQEEEWGDGEPSVPSQDYCLRCEERGSEGLCLGLEATMDLGDPAHGCRGGEGEYSTLPPSTRCPFLCGPGWPLLCFLCRKGGCLRGRHRCLGSSGPSR